MTSKITSAVKDLFEEARREFSELSDTDWETTTVVVEILPGVKLGKFSLKFLKKEKGQ